MLKSMIYTLVTADKKKELELLLFVQAPTVHAMVFRRVSFAYAWKYSLGSKLDSVFSDQNWMALVLDSSFDKQLIEQFPAGACLKCQVNLSFLPPILDIFLPLRTYVRPGRGNIEVSDIPSAAIQQTPPYVLKSKTQILNPIRFVIS